MTASAAAPALPAEIIGLTRLAFDDIQHQHQAIMAAAFRLPPKVVEGLAYGFTRKRATALVSLDRLMPVAPTIVTPKAVVYRTVRICRQPLSDDLTHHGAEVVWLSVGMMRGRATVTDRPASLFVGFHTAARLLQRVHPRPDIRSTILAAHDVLRASPEGVLLVLEANRRWLLPVAGGAFACDCNVIRDRTSDTHVYMRAKTFLAGDNLDAAQQAQCTAMLFRDGGRTLGDGLCQPPQLRPFLERSAAM